jgi:PAS domain S-box-containing protein
MQAQRPQLLDAAVTTLREAVPAYTRVDRSELRASLDGLLTLLGEHLAEPSGGPTPHILHDVSKRRLEQGFSSSDMLRAALLMGPVVRQVLGHDSFRLEEYARLDALLTEFALIASNAFIEASSRKLEAKSQALRRMNDELIAHRDALSHEVRATSRALASERTLNRKIVESLASGIIGVSPDLEVVLYSPRAEQILGLPTEAILGQPLLEAAAGITGIDIEGTVAAVRSRGELPLTKMKVGTPNGQERWLFVSARRLMGDHGESEGTVIVFDDVTERELLLDSFSRYVSRDVVHRLLARGHIELTGERRRISVLFADIRGFTGIAERSDPEALHTMLNRYFRVMIEAVADAGGFVDKFVGDKVMALFGHNTSPELGARQAVQAALRIQDQLACLDPEEGAPIAVGIGINTGDVVLGNVGSERRMEFTAIGDAVNVADRLQSLARRGEVLVGPQTAAIVADDPLVTLLPRGDHQLKGRAEPVPVHEVRPTET